MSKPKKINVGIIGLGTVGTGVARVLIENAGIIKDRLGCELVLKRAADKDLKRDRDVKLPSGVLTPEAGDVINDPDISIVVELVGGTGVAKDFILSAIDAGKHVATANKALISTHGRELFERAAKKGVDIGFEASVGGGIPILKALREGLSANNIDSIYGIINGTANYILTKMTKEGGKFEDVLKEAQALGYAEADPTYDVEGIDTAHKLAILVNLAFGTYITHDDIYTEGISRITEIDVNFAREFGYSIKLLAIAKVAGASIEARVHPTMVPLAHPLSTIDGAYNAVYVHGNAVGATMFYGKGAGMMPTASAVVADIVDIARDMLSGSNGRLTPLGFTSSAVKDIEIKKMEEIASPYYLRLSALDAPGVLSKISGILGAHNISIASVLQKGRQEEGGGVPLVIVTHAALEAELRMAFAEIEALDVVPEKIMSIRIEEKIGGED